MKQSIVKTMITAMLCVAAATRAGAQQDKRTEVPKEQLPPAGMCRIWIDGVPAGQQPAPTDCPTAVKNRPSNGRVLFGDDYAKSNKKPLPVKRFTDDPPAPPAPRKLPPVDSLKSSKPRRPLIQLIKPGGR
jgi:hypothetical protein